MIFKCFLIFCLCSLVACQSDPSTQSRSDQINKKLLAEQSPLRVHSKSYDNGDSSFTFEWAGRPGSSIVESLSPELKADVLKGLQYKCGFSEAALKEIRIVEHRDPIFYEVWVFDNPASRRPDKSTGIAVIYTASSLIGTALAFNGACQ